MESKRTAKLHESLDHLKEAIRAYEKRRKADPLPRLALTKAFEIAVEYGWRELKRRAEDEGLDVPSPKAAVRQAARLAKRCLELVGKIAPASKWRRT